MDDLLREFLIETGESLDVIDVALLRFEEDPADAATLAGIFRLVHTIKGTCGFLGLPRLERLTHAAETVMGRLRDGAAATPEAVGLVVAAIDRVKRIVAALNTTGAEPDGDDADLVAALDRVAAEAPGAQLAAAGNSPARADARPDFARVAAELGEAMARTGAAPSDKVAQPDAGTVRVAVETLEGLMTLVSELVLTRNQLLDLTRRHELPDFKVPLQRLSSVTADLQDGVMKTRLQPIGAAWQKLPRIVRDLARDLGKDIELATFGADTELDRQVLERIRDPLTHMVRNSADHGLETSAERRAAGKSGRGTIRLSARHEGGQVLLEIADDGRGLDLAGIRRKAVERGLADAAAVARMSDREVARFIFAPGFSTAAAVTSVSGRGVGMDVVASNIAAIGGAIDLWTAPGEGTRVTIRIPLTLAIMATLIVVAGGERYALPQASVVEVVRAGADEEIERLGERPVLRLRDRLLALAPLGTLLGGATVQGPGYVVVMEVGRRRFGVLVDDVLHTEEIVVKPLSQPLRRIGMFSGNTLLGDGSVILILDPDGLARAIGAEEGSAGDAAIAGLVEDEGTVPMLLVAAGSGAPKALPLSLVTRLEEVAADLIERAGGRDVVHYRGGLMPVVRLGDDAPTGEGRQPLVVIAGAGRPVGLAVDRILDIVDAPIAPGMTSLAPESFATTIIAGAAADLLDIAPILAAADVDAPARQGRHLLLVDDDAFFRDMLAPVLRAAGHRVTLAGSGYEALQRFRDGVCPDLVISDVEMPGMDGFALAEALRGDARHAALPLVALSAACTPVAIARARAAGFDDYVGKFDRQGLLAAIDELCAERMEIAA